MKKTKRSQQQRKLKVLLIGDNCTDVYRYGTVDRISPEAPVPIFKFSREESRPGMVGNVKANLEALGIEVSCLTGNSSTKTRLIDTKSRQHILRIDDDVISSSLRFESIASEFFEVDAVVISDYEKGYVNYTLVRDIRDHFAGPIFLDTKKTDLEYFEGCIVKVNAQEREAATSICSDIIVTRGEQGAEYNGIIYPGKSIDVADVCGAGDTFLAALTYQYLKTDDMIEAIKFAVLAGAVTVQHPGVYAPKLEEIK